MGINERKMTKIIGSLLESLGFLVMRRRADGPIITELNHAFRLWNPRSPLSRREKETRTDQLCQRASQLAYLSRVLDLLKVDCVIDIGANEGQFGRDLRLLGFDGPIYSFEPTPSIFMILNNNVKNEENWHIFNFGCSSEDKKVYMNVYKDSSLSSVNEINDVGIRVAGGLSEFVKTEPATLKLLDEFYDKFRAFNSILFKSDTQGHDLEVLKGASRVLDLASVVLLEVPVQQIYKTSFTGDEAVDLLAQHGFLPVRAFPVNSDEQLRIIELDQFFMRESGAR